MQKISGIISSNARLNNVDMKDAHPVRPGVPAFGRPSGTSKLRDTVRKSTIDTMLDRPMTDREASELKNAQIVERVSSAFFMKKSPEVSSTPPDTAYSGHLDLSDSSSYEPRESFDDYDSVSDYSEEAPQYLAPGSYIDINV